MNDTDALRVLRVVGAHSAADVLEGFLIQRDRERHERGAKGVQEELDRAGVASGATTAHPAATALEYLGEYLLSRAPNFPFEGSAADFAIQLIDALHLTPMEIEAATIHRRAMLHEDNPLPEPASELGEAGEFGMWLTTRAATVVAGQDHTAYSMVDALREWEKVKRNRATDQERNKQASETAERVGTTSVSDEQMQAAAEWPIGMPVIVVLR